MAKRTRYSGRPGVRHTGTRTTLPGASPQRPGSLTDAEIQRAAEIEAELVAREREAITENARRRARTRGLEAGVAADPSLPLSVRASHEYDYVARDVRRIGITASVMFGILAVLWLIVNVGGVGIF